MTLAYAVIGANYGDEGKGLMVDYLCRHKANPVDTTVVRFNGGAQAGHTVTLPSGHRHVFHHLGSGTLAGAATLLSQFFISNPAVFRAELEAIGLRPQVSVHHLSPITTPFEMIINQSRERGHGIYRHGSCGLGIFDTVRRERDPKLVLNVGHVDSMSMNQFQDRVRMIRKELTKQHPAYAPELDAFSDAGLERWFDDCAFFAQNIKMYSSVRSHDEDVVIFEGAQGLALDQDNMGDYPHLTPSNTGMKNVSILAHQMGINLVRPVYVSRTYLTRHGAGPLPNGLDAMPSHCIDPTNVPNEFQGTMRFAPLDEVAMHQRIITDIAKATLPVEPALALTCADQIGPPDEPIFRPRYISYGPTHQDVKES